MMFINNCDYALILRTCVRACVCAYMLACVIVEWMACGGVVLGGCYVWQNFECAGYGVLLMVSYGRGVFVTIWVVYGCLGNNIGDFI